MNKKIVAWAVMLLLVFGAATHPATAGQWLHKGYSDIFLLARNLHSFATSAKG